MKKIRTAAVIPFVLGFALSGAALAEADATSNKAVEPDNSAVNKSIENNQQPTADDQSNAKGDVELAAKIRKALVDDKSLSTYGHNVKVIVKNGVATIKGPVQSETERRAVEKIAAGVAGSENVKTDGVVAKK